MKRSPLFFAVLAFFLTASPALADLTSAAVGAALTAGIAVATGIGLVVSATATPAVAMGVGVGTLSGNSSIRT